MFQRRTLIIVFVIVALGLAFGTFFFRSNHNKQPVKKVEASSANATITLQTDWDGGTKDNIDSSSSPGIIKIQNYSQSKLSFTSVSCTTYNGSSSLLDDGSVSSGSWDHGDPAGTCQFDLGSVKTITSARVNATASTSGGTSFSLFAGTNPGSHDHLYHAFFIELPLNQTWVDFSDLSGPVELRYFELVPIWDFPMEHIFTNEFEVYESGASAIHTTGATQIDGGENFWQWESFTPTQSIPANTSITYRYRSSTNGIDWTSWVGAIGSVTSRSGDDSNNPTKYRYLQIEATLRNTDGASTPTIDSYTIGYHTNQKPNKPTAQTAVIN